MIALATFQTTHAAANVLVFFGSLMLAVLVPRVLGSLISTSTATNVGAGGFLGLCAVVHLGLALRAPYSTVVTIADHLEAVCVLLFLYGVLSDLHSAVERLRAAYVGIGVKYGKEVGNEVMETVRNALEGR